MRNTLIYLSIFIGFFGGKTTPNNNEMGKENALNAEAYGLLICPKVILKQSLQAITSTLQFCR